MSVAVSYDLLQIGHLYIILFPPYIWLTIAVNATIKVSPHDATTGALRTIKFFTLKIIVLII
jgi:hypothetical protein